MIDGDTDGHTGQRRCVFVLAGLCQRDGVTHQHLYQNDRQLKCLTWEDQPIAEIFLKKQERQKKVRVGG